ncbi:hypothetical protein ACFV3R_11700 [Streptomyces sp. NPDC059740]|uniref:hypothetical protein n=1 Tax=Streptomyces sp. NPDC059740 TaxID=3346926 RepID=UPI0036648CF4
MPEADLSAAGVPKAALPQTDEFLRLNETELAFDMLVYLGEELAPPHAFWRHLAEAAREMDLYAQGPDSDLFAAAELCRRRLAAAGDSDWPERPAAR